MQLKKEGHTSNPTSAPRRLRTGLWVALAILAAVCFLLFRRWSGSGFNSQEFLRSFASADWRWLFAAWLFTILSYYVRVLRWLVMLRPIAPHASQAALFRATAIGFSAVYLFGRPGELVRPYLTARSAGVSFLSQMAAWLLERIYDTLLVLALFGYALAALVQTRPNVGPTLHWVIERGGWITAITSLVCLAALAALQLYSESLASRLLDALGFLQAHHQQRAAKLVGAAVEGLRSTGNPRAIALLLFWSAVEWYVIYLSFWAIFQAFTPTAPLGTTAILTYIGFVAFGSLVQIPGIGGGFQIVAVLVLTEIFHLPLELSASVALVTWIVSLVGILPLGVALAFYEGLTWRNIIDIEKEAAS